MAKRYSQSEKDEILAFVEQYNKEKGRGGQTAAKNKFKVNAVTLKSWMDKAGMATPVKGKKKSSKKSVRTAAPAPAAQPLAAPVSKGTSVLSAKLNKLVSIQSKIDDLQRQFDEVKASL